MILAVEILIATLIVLAVGTPIVTAVDKWKKEMGEDK